MVRHLRVQLPLRTWHPPYQPRTTFCITIANKMVDDLKCCLKEIQHILDSFDLNHVYVFLNIVYLIKVL